MRKKGTFIISLDFELHWGIFDVKTINDYKENLDGTRLALDSIVNLSNNYNIRLTIATVGFLFCENKAEILKFSPHLKPTYTRSALNPYAIIDEIGNSEEDDPYHYALSTISDLSSQHLHEISTHTFSHYYCKEGGQNIEQFESDLKSAIKLAESKGIVISSIIFPRNQVDIQYLKICKANGLTSYRGNEIKGAYSTNFKEGIIKKGLRLVDSYINLYGFQTYDVDFLKHNNDPILNLPSSRFLRPFNSSLRPLERLKVQRIKRSMTYAAKKGELYHLWWHPHNFGVNIEENIRLLQEIYSHYSFLNEIYGFKSETMTSFAQILK